MINLGDEVRDSVSGFKGIAVSKHVYLHGCTRITVCPKVGKDGSFKDERAFDEPQLILIKPKVNKEGRHTTGGPMPYKDRPKATGERKY